MPSLHGTLPNPRTRLIGRVKEQAAARSALLDDTAPLLTLTGAGGVGKTRLALAIAHDVAPKFSNGVAWVDLAPVEDAQLVSDAVCSALGLAPRAEKPLADQLVRRLHTRQTLLLFDNCEHVLDEVAILASHLLARCPALQVLATSRSPLRIRGEQILTVSPLPLLPAPADATTMQLAANQAVRLFAERAQAVGAPLRPGRDDLEAAAEICRQVDGLPLAIELAAARTRSLPVTTLRDRLPCRLPMLDAGERDAPARQRTMRDTIAWSHNLLDADAQAMFRRLAVFAGGFTLEAAQFVTTDGEQDDVLPLLESLIDHHLVVPHRDRGRPCFTMLETIREYGLEQLARSHEAASLRSRHAAYVAYMVSSLDAFWAPFLANPGQILDRLEGEYPNLHAALAWSRSTGDAARVLEIAGQLRFFWQLRGHLREGRRWLEWALEEPVQATPGTRAAGQVALAGILYQQFEFSEALHLCDESIRLFQRTGDLAGVAHAAECALPAAINSGQIDRATTYLGLIDAALADLGNLPWVDRLSSHLATHRGLIAMYQHGPIEAHRVYAELVDAQDTLARESEEATSYACWPLHRLGVVEVILDQPAAGLAHLQAAIRHAWKAGEHAGVAASVMSVAGILARYGRWQEAAHLFGAAESICEQAGYRFWTDFWPWERAYGLPEPWQQADVSLGNLQWLRDIVLAEKPATLPPLPDAAAAASRWAAGRRLPIADAVARALSVNLDDSPTSDAAGPADSRAVPGQCTLSSRERDVLVLLCQRWTDPQIAEHLFLSPRTVESHVASILRKLDVTNRRDAVAEASRRGLVHA
jgi:predicted ATPase/DNA-binding CsgD family transcriptional regulator